MDTYPYISHVSTYTPKFNIAPEKLYTFPIIVFQPSIFRCYVTFREGKYIQIARNSYLAGGWTNPFEKKHVQLDHFPRVRGKHNKCLKSPPSYLWMRTGQIRPRYTGASPALVGKADPKGLILDKQIYSKWWIIPWEPNITAVDRANRDTQETTYWLGFIWMCLGHLRVKFLFPPICMSCCQRLFLAPGMNKHVLDHQTTNTMIEHESDQTDRNLSKC